MIVVTIILAIAIAGIVLYVIAKTPKLAPKKRIVETILNANDELFTYRQDVRGLISDNLNMYQQHDQRSLTHRYGTADRRRQDIKQKLSTAENDLLAYGSAKTHRGFYEHAHATVDVLAQIVSRLAELQDDSKVFASVIASLQQLGTMTQNSTMNTYISDDDETVVDRVADHIDHIVALANQTIQQVNDLQCNADEFRHVTQSVAIALKKAAEDYTNLRSLLEAKQYEQYRSALHSLPNFSGRFDINSYEAILTASFAQQPEESYIKDIRTHLYT